MNHFKKILFLCFVLFCIVPNVNAADNNKFGIHLAVPATEQLERAAELVNSNGGDWGYVTLVMQENDRDHNKWQQIFDTLRELHLIPIIRLATIPQGPVWRRPMKEDADQWVNFLNGLNWVVKDRYIVLFNEPNHGAEWGGIVDPSNYADVAKTFAEKLKSKNNDFFVMLGGLDASAPAASPSYANEESFLSTVIDSIGKDSFNSLFSGLSSHSYPNPGFSGSPTASGRTSVRTYEWELSLLEGKGVKELPVFITETGWDGNNISRDSVSNNFYTAYTNVWLPDDRVKAVTPFVLDYQGAPFLGFSWKQLGSDSYYSQFNTVEGMNKKAGDPEIIQKGSITFDLPHDFVQNSNYHYRINLYNSGQAIWDERFGYKLGLENFDSTFFFSDMGSVNPKQSTAIDMYFKTGSKPISNNSKIVLYKGDKKVLESSVWKYDVVPLPKLDFRVSLYPRLKQKGNDFEIQVFDSKEQLVYKTSNIKVEHGSGSVGQIRNITLDRKYRIVILKKYYLPRQTFLTFQRGTNEVIFEKMFPFDFNGDGALNFADIWALITNPSRVSLLFP